MTDYQIAGYCAIATAVGLGLWGAVEAAVEWIKDAQRMAEFEKDMLKAVVKLTKKLYKKESAFITLIYGQDVSEEDAQIAADAIAAKVPTFLGACGEGP